MKKLLTLLIVISFVSCNNDHSDVDSSLPSTTLTNIPPPKPLLFTVTGVYPHDSSAFTQGLELYQGKLYEGTGEYGKSRLRVTDYHSGKVETDVKLSDNSIFGEGITIFKNRLYQLTWQNNKIFEYDLDNLSKPTATYTWSREGWGLTNDGEQLIISDGTSKLYFVVPDPEKLSVRVNKIITVRNHLGEVDQLNELELINGYVFANRWQTDEIVKIDTTNGQVVGIMNMKGLLPQYAPEVIIREEAVLNGIAYNAEKNTLLITGKDWPRLFEIKLNN